MKDCLQYIYKRINDDPQMLEDELYEVLVSSGFFKKLGYKKFGKDVRAQYVVAGKMKKADYICRDEYQNVIFVLEAKRPSDRNLRAALGQLWQRYVLPLKARYGVLTNGRRILIYKRVMTNPEAILNLNLSKVTEKGCNALLRALSKPEYNITLHAKLEEYFLNVDKLSLETDLAKENFFETFKLEKNSAFGLLLSTLVNLFDWVHPRSKFLKGAYGFWQKSLARGPKKIPDSWKPFLEKDRDIFKFMFCIETAHAILARLILAKACEDLDFPGINISNFTLQKIHQARGLIPLIGYPIVLDRLIKEMRDQLVYSIFEEDIFSWWKDAFTDYMEKSSGELLREKVDKSLEDFSRTIAKVILMLYKFDFKEVAGDPLGDLYQQYFDKDTRKALGEFYTPVEVVDYILDAVGYKNIGSKRLLDPACGSGTFIVEALKRYLKEAGRRAKQHGWAFVLRELCNSPKIVGFDIHPFACLIARTRFMLELIPYFKKALEEEAPHIFYLQRIPIFRTDSLAIEILPPEFQKQSKLHETEEDIVFPIILPMRIDSESTISVKIALPSWRKIASHGILLYNLGEYFCTLQAMFDAVKHELNVRGDFITENILQAYLKEYLKDKEFILIANFFKPYANRMISEIKRIQSEYEDGRLIKSIEDAVLATLLKNYIKYDFVVGNPPYVEIKKIDPISKKRYKEDFISATKKYDLYVLFMERGIKWMISRGRFGFIVSNKFMLADYGFGIRNVILKNCRIIQLIDFGDTEIFSEVTNYPCIIVLDKTKADESVFKFVKVKKQKENLLAHISINILKKEHSDELIDIQQVSQNTLSKKAWIIMRETHKFIMKHLERMCTLTLDEICMSISKGIDPGGATNIFIVDDSIIRKFQLEKDLIKPILRGRDVKRWSISWTNLFIIYPYLKTGEPVDLRTHPAINRYLEENRNKLQKRNYVLKSGKKWYELWNQRRLEVLNVKKIVVPNISRRNNFALDEDGRFFYIHTVYSVILKEKYDLYYEYILGILNSKPLEFYFKNISPFLQGRFHRYGTLYMKQLPIKLPKTPEEEQIASQIVENVKRIYHQVDPMKLIKGFPDTYLGEYRSKGVEFDEVRVTFNLDHNKLKPFLSGFPGKGFSVFPSEDEDSIWVDTTEKAQYLILALKNRKVKQNDIVKILVPRNNTIVTEILKKVKKTADEIRDTSIEQLEEKLNEKVYQLYGLNEDDKAIIEGFLKKF